VLSKIYPCGHDFKFVFVTSRSMILTKFEDTFWYFCISIQYVVRQNHIFSISPVEDRMEARKGSNETGFIYIFTCMLPILVK